MWKAYILSVPGVNARSIDASGFEFVGGGYQCETAPDPGDDFLWRLLAARSGAGLITGDAALLERPPPGARVISPRAWVDEQSAH